MGFLDSSNEGGGVAGVPDGGGLNSAFAGLGAVMAWDMADSVSYANIGDTAIQNVITSPADSELQTTYDGTVLYNLYHQNEIGKQNGYHLIGIAGEYMDYNNKTTFMNAMHKAGATWTVSFTWKSWTNTGSNIVLWSSTNGTGATRLGVSIVKVSNTSIEFRISNGATYEIQQAFTITSLSNYKDYCFTLTFDDATGVANLYVNGTKYTATGLTMSTPATGDRAIAGQYGFGSGGDGFEAGVRLYGCALFNTLFSDANEQTVREGWTTSNGRTYD